MLSLRQLVRLDGFAALSSGGFVLALTQTLAGLSGIPVSTLHNMALVSLVYAAYSLSLATFTDLPRRAIQILVVANSAWALVCLGVLWIHNAAATPFGYAYMIGEAAFVAGLAYLESRHC
jgi:hypothetical protein